MSAPATAEKSSQRRPRVLTATALAVCAGMLGGCFGKPNQANIDLRKSNQQLEAKVQELVRQREADLARIYGLESRATTVPVLPQAELDKLYTAQSLSLGSATGGVDVDPDKPGDEGIKVYAVPLDADNDKLKVAGSFVIEAFDLELAHNQRIGRWTFSVEQAKENWYSMAWLYSYIFTCPWQTVPQHPQITIKVTFTDALTGRLLTAQKVATVHLPPATQPAK